MRLFGLWCPILGGSPPVTVVHVFDYPYEDNGSVFSVFEDFGDIKRVKNQTCLWNNKIFTTTTMLYYPYENPRRDTDQIQAIKKNANQRDLNVTSHSDNSADTSETNKARIERDMCRRDIWIARRSDNPVIFKP